MGVSGFDIEQNPNLKPETRNSKLETRASLLVRLKDWQDNESWQAFFDRYWPLIYGTAIKSGLSPAEAEDVVQETVLVVARKIKEFQYDPSRGKFRAWLGTVIRSRVVDRFRKRLPVKSPTLRETGDSARTGTVARVADPAALDFLAIYDLAWQEHVREAALRLLKEELSPRQYELFDRYVNKNQSVATIMKAMGVSRAQIYMAKLRGLQTLKQTVRQVEKSLEQGGI